MTKLNQIIDPTVLQATRRHFIKESFLGLGGLALGTMLGSCKSNSSFISNNLSRIPHFAPRAKSVIYMHMAGAPSQLELFDYKPELLKWMGNHVRLPSWKVKNLPSSAECLKC